MLPNSLDSCTRARPTCSPASTQSISVLWKNLVRRSVRKRLFFVCARGGLEWRQLRIQFLSSFWYDTRTFTGWPCGTRSWYHVFTSGTSCARRVWPERLLKGAGAKRSAMPAAVCGPYSGVSASMGPTSGGSAKSSASEPISAVAGGA